MASAPRSLLIILCLPMAPVLAIARTAHSVNGYFICSTWASSRSPYGGHHLQDCRKAQGYLE
jgi:hypothetical protein